MGKVLDFFQRSSKQDIHCTYCMTPSDVWKPLRTYSADDCCEVFNDFFDVIEELEELKSYSYTDVLKRCEFFKKKYPGIEDVEATIRELIEIELDIGVMTSRYRAKLAIV